MEIIERGEMPPVLGKALGYSLPTTGTNLEDTMRIMEHLKAHPDESYNSY